MAGRKKQKRPNYGLRRFCVVVGIVAVVGVLVWRFGPFGGKEAEAAGAPPTDPSEHVEDERSPSQVEPEPESSAGQAEEKSSEPGPESEPEPVPAGDWSLILVNSTSPLPDDFTVELETLEDGFQVDARIADSVRRMYTQAREEGISLVTCSAYRSPEKQRQNYDRQVQAYLDQGVPAEEADALTVAYIARPGESEHHTGLAVDIVTPEYQDLDEGFAATPAAKWLSENAHKFGFILRYPKNKEPITQINYEPWHFRYVGEEHAAAVKEAGYCLEEYLQAAAREQIRDAQQPDVEEEKPSDGGGEDGDEES